MNNENEGEDYDFSDKVDKLDRQPTDQDINGGKETVATLNWVCGRESFGTSN